MDSGFCFVTFSEHTAPVTAVSFLPTSSAAVSASLDGTVRAWDLLRYRNFRTMTSPDPVQLASLAVDPAGEVLHCLCMLLLSCTWHFPYVVVQARPALARAALIDTAVTKSSVLRTFPCTVCERDAHLCAKFDIFGTMQSLVHLTCSELMQ